MDVALELIWASGHACRRRLARWPSSAWAALAGITGQSFEIAPDPHEVLNKEAEIIGVSDHLAQELPLLLEWAGQGKLDLSAVITRVVPLEARAINHALDRLDRFSEDVRVVVRP